MLEEVYLFNKIMITSFLKVIPISLSLGFAQPLLENSSEQWPMAAGPSGSWTVKTEKQVPKEWSVTTGKNVVWKTILPEGGQSGIAVWGDRLFLTINEPLPLETPEGEARGANIIGYCLEASSGKVLWKVPIEGTKEYGHSGAFSDASCPTPVTDGKHVWFVNAGGTMACYDMTGKEVWKKAFEVRRKHAAKQCEPILYGDLILYVMMLDDDDPKKRPMKAIPGDRDSDPSLWPRTCVRAFKKSDGSPIWSEYSGTSVHNTPSIRLIDGVPYLYHIRGGGHKPPEQPYGVSFTKLGGEEIWSFDSKNPFAYTVTNFDDQVAYLVEKGDLVKLSIKDGSEVSRIPLFEKVDLRLWNEESHRYEVFQKAPFTKVIEKFKPYPTNQTTIPVDNYYLFLSHEGYCVGRVNTDTGKVEYLQLPTQVVRSESGEEKKLWGTNVPNKAINSRGVNVGSRKSEGDGWGHFTCGSPIVVNGKVYFSTILGMTYVINSKAEIWDESAIIAINDLGPAGNTWSLSTPSYSNGKIYHRGLKYVVCIGVE